MREVKMIVTVEVADDDYTNEEVVQFVTGCLEVGYEGAVDIAFWQHKDQMPLTIDNVELQL